ncbi:MAG TPA: DUF2231 domain-containing protein [Pseudonocardiaceae bacterium]
MLPIQRDLITIDGIPAHPLLVHAVVVLLPLAALGGLVIAARASWRRRFGPAVLALTAVGVAAVPLATRTGNQLKNVLPANPAIDRHAELGNNLLPFALAYGVAVLLLVIAGRLADRERGADTAAGASAGSGDGDGALRVTRTWRRVAIVAAALVAFTATAATVQIVRIGHSGSAAVWKGVGGGS